MHVDIFKFVRSHKFNNFYIHFVHLLLRLADFNLRLPTKVTFQIGDFVDVFRRVRKIAKSDY